MHHLRAHLLVGFCVFTHTLDARPAQAADGFSAPVFARLATFDAGRLAPVSESTVGLDRADFAVNETIQPHGLTQIDAVAAYVRGYTGHGVLVAVVDSGLDAGHPEFAGRVAAGSRNFEPNSEDSSDFDDIDPLAEGHGTHVAGIIAAARDGRAMHGVAYEAEILALRSVGNGGGNTAEAIAYAASKGARVLNGSFGPSYERLLNKDGTPNPAYVRYETTPIGPSELADAVAMKAAADAGMLLVFAAGNERREQPIIGANPTGGGLYPYIRPAHAATGVYQVLEIGADGFVPADQSTLDFSSLAASTLAVVAVDAKNQIAEFSNLCGVAASWCLAAPGVEILSTVPRGTGPFANAPDYNFQSGTSQAAPHVSGAAAVLFQAFPFLTAPQVAQTLLTTATDIGPSEIYGWGLLNLGKAINGPGRFTSTWNVDTDGYFGRFSNDIDGAGGLTKAGAGTLALAGANTYAGGTFVAEGTLLLEGSVTSEVVIGEEGMLRGTGRIDAPLVSAGVVRPGASPGTLTVAGPVTLGSTSLLALDIDGTGTGTGAGNYSRLLAVGSTGSVEAGGVLVPVLRGITGSATNTYTPVLGTRLRVLVAEAGLDRSFSGLAQPSAGLAQGTRFDALYGASSLDLVVTPGRYAGLAALGLPQSGNERAVGGALDAARPTAGMRPDARHAAIYDALYTVPAAKLPSTLASLTGQSYGDAVMADLASRRLVAGSLDRHITSGDGAGVGLRSGESGGALGPNLDLRTSTAAAATRLAPGEGRLWGEGLYGFGGRDGDRSASGARFDSGGLLVGLDRQVGADSIVGAAFSYQRNEGSSLGNGRDLGRFKIDSYGGNLYGATRLGALELRGTVGAAYADTRVTRSVAIGTLQSSTGGRPSGYDISASGFAGYRIASGLAYDVIPEAGLTYDHLQRGRVTETGGVGSLNVATRDVEALRSLVGGRVATALTTQTAGALSLDLRAYWSHELADNTALIRSNLLGASFAAVTSAPSRDGAVLGASLSGTLAPGLRLSANYTGEIRRNADGHLLSMSLLANW